MAWLDVAAVGIAAATVAGTGASLVRYWRAPKGMTPLEGRRTHVREWFEQCGYEIVQTGERIVWRGYIDAAVCEQEWHVDFIIRKGAREYAVIVADDETLQAGPCSLCASWYPVCVALDVQGLLLVNPEGETVRQVEFELERPARVLRKRLLRRAGWIGAGVLMAMAWFHAV
jgi:hypothetical protein